MNSPLDILLCYLLGLCFFVYALKLAGLKIPIPQLGKVFTMASKCLVFLFYTLPFGALEVGGAYAGDNPRSIKCKHCHQNLPKVAIVTCSSCRYRSRRKPFSPCPCCGTTNRFVTCHCGMSIKRSHLWTQKRPRRSYR